MTTDDDLLRKLSEGLGQKPPKKLGLAVSGGGDSLAMLHLAARLAPAHSIRLSAATVNHGLRDAAADEARMVAQTCADLNIPHQTLTWQRPPGAGNLQDQARRGRYRLMAEWAVAQQLDAVALAHTQDDVAETFLMRLSRRAGVDGLSSLSSARSDLGVWWHRPLLDVSRADLRAFLTRNGVSWADDPSNCDDSYLRVRARKALVELAPLGIDASVLADVAVNLTTARDGLRMVAFKASERAIQYVNGDLLIDIAAIREEHHETQRRIMASALMFVSGADYQPRAEKLWPFWVAVIDQAQQATLHGCIGQSGNGIARIHREYQAVRNTTSVPGAIWDKRWILTGPDSAECVVKALGPDGLPQCPDWRDTGIPRAALLASPAVWRHNRLISAPLAGFANGWTATLAPNCVSFDAFLLSH